jgi:hypothetical protein
MFYAGKRRPQKGTAMTVIEIPDDQAAVLKALAAAQGLTFNACKKLAENKVAAHPNKPLKSAYGLLAEYGPAPSAEEITRSGATCSGVSARED